MDTHLEHLRNQEECLIVRASIEGPILQENFSFFFLLVAAWVKSRAERPSVRLQENFSRRVVDMHPTHACTIFETTNYRRGTKQSSHVKGAHDDTQLLGSCESQCCTGIGFFKLSYILGPTPSIEGSLKGYLKPPLKPPLKV